MSTVLSPFTASSHHIFSSLCAAYAYIYIDKTLTLTAFFLPNIHERFHPGLVETVCTKIWMWQLLYKLNDQLVNGINFIIISVFPKLITFFHPDYFLSRRLVAIIWRTMIICTEIDQHVSITEQQYSTQFYCIYWMLYRDFGNWERPYCHLWDRQWAADTSFAH